MRNIKQITSVFVIILLLSISFSSTIALQEYTLEYDANGNTIKDNFYSYEYNSFNQLKKVYNSAGQLTEEYKYDENGERILKKEYFNGETQTTYYVSKDFVRIVNSTGSYDFVYYYDDRGNLLGRKDSDGKKYFYHPDHLGSTSIVTDEEGNVVEETSYTPFGALLTGGNSKFLYTGKEKDMTGLYYYGARYYNANFGRFTQPDTIIPDVYDPQSLNRYSYVRNNPYKYVDPTGHFFDTIADIGFIGYDIWNIIKSPTDWGNWAALGGDVAFAFVPFATGGGTIAKTMINAGAKVADKINDVDNVVDGVKAVDKIGEGSKLSKKGVDIVGSDYKAIKPMQSEIKKSEVNKFQKLINNNIDVGKINVIDNEGYGKFIDDGHHRFVAYKKAGYEISEIPMEIEYINDPFRVGFNSWKKTKYIK